MRAPGWSRVAGGRMFGFQRRAGRRVPVPGHGGLGLRHGAPGGEESRDTSLAWTSGPHSFLDFPGTLVHADMCYPIPISRLSLAKMTPPKPRSAMPPEASQRLFRAIAKEVRTCLPTANSQERSTDWPGFTSSFWEVVSYLGNGELLAMCDECTDGHACPLLSPCQFSPHPFWGNVGFPCWNPQEPLVDGLSTA